MWWWLVNKVVYTLCNNFGKYRPIAITFNFHKCLPWMLYVCSYVYADKFTALHHIEFSNFLVELCSCTFKFRKLVLCGNRLEVRWSFYTTFLSSTSENTTVKELLKSVYICQSYCKNKSGTLFWDTVYMTNTFEICTTRPFSLCTVHLVNFHTHWTHYILSRDLQLHREL